MHKNLIRLERTDNGYIIKETCIVNQSLPPEFLQAYKAWIIEKEEIFIGCMECTYKDFARIGSREEDTSRTIISASQDKQKVDSFLYAEMRKQAEEFVYSRGEGYSLEDFTRT